MASLVCFALKEEAAPVLADGHHLHSGLHILLTGIGRVNAEKSIREFLAKSSPELVLTCGFAGGLNPDLKIGDVVFEIPSCCSRGNEAQTETQVGGSQREVTGSDNTSFRQRLIAAGAKPVKFFCADRIATTVAEKKQLRAETGADAVEMESAAIHAVCIVRGIPCATVRVISDAANEDLPLDFNRLFKPDKSMDIGKLILAIGKSPGKIGPLMELQRKTKFAAERLAEVLNEILR